MVTACIENLSVFHGVIICTGFSSVGPPTLYYDGVQLASLNQVVQRPDLVVHHGSAAVDWGYKLCAIPSHPNIDHLKISARVLGGDVLLPGRFSPPSSIDLSHAALQERFRSETERGGRLLEIGSRARSGNIYKSMFNEKIDYVGLDVTDGPNVDVVADAHHMSRHLGGKFDFVFSISVFEHILMPWKVAIEMAEVMNLGGIGFIQSHAAFPLHEQPWDFWRYSKDAWRGIFNIHTGFEVLDSAYSGLAWTVPAFASGGAAQDMDLHPNYLLSACLIRKIGDPQVRWNAEASEVYDLEYRHA